jgi:hypothetical protein
MPQKSSNGTQQSQIESASDHTREQSPVEQEISQFLDTLFELLEREGILFCVLRNRDYIPNGLINGGDIDLCIAESVGGERLLAALLEFEPVHISRRREVIHSYFSITPDFLLHIDFRHINSEWLGALVLENDEMIEYAQIDRGIPVASLTHQAILAWLDNILWGGVFKQRYNDLILRQQYLTPTNCT